MNSVAVELSSIKNFLCVSQNNRFYSRNPEPNPEQARAIHHIVQGSSRPAPYIVFGPPGTGKTFTIVESIKQVYILEIP